MTDTITIPTLVFWAWLLGVAGVTAIIVGAGSYHAGYKEASDYRRLNDRLNRLYGPQSDENP